MRKIGIVCLILGALIAVVNGALRQTDWFAAESAAARSEQAEWVVSFFWAGLATAAFGLLFFFLSFRSAERDAVQDGCLPRHEEPATWICPSCGMENAADTAVCLNCRASDYLGPEPGDEDWAPDPALFTPDAAPDGAEATRRTRAASARTGRGSTADATVRYAPTEERPGDDGAFYRAPKEL